MSQPKKQEGDRFARLQTRQRAKREKHPDDFRMPPLRRCWKLGTHQVGLFVRFPDGSKMELVCNRVTTPGQVDTVIRQLTSIRARLEDAANILPTEGNDGE